jgi:hypothetical protein
MKNALVIFLSVASAFAASALEVDGIAAQVGTESILRSDVYGEMRRRGLPDGEKYIEVRNEMIKRKLIAKAAQEAKMQTQCSASTTQGIKNTALGLLAQASTSPLIPQWKGTCSGS